MAVQPQPPPIALDGGGVQVEVVDVRGAAGAVHDEARLDGLVRAGALGYPEPAADRLDPFGAAVESNVDAAAAGFFEDLRDQIAIELRERPRVFVQDRRPMKAIETGNW